MKKLLLSLMILILISSQLYAEEINSSIKNSLENSPMFQEAKNVAEKSKNMVIPEHIKKSAEAVFNTINSGHTKIKIDDYKNMIDYDPDTGIIKFSQGNKKDKKSQSEKSNNGIFNNDERVYIFISSSIPENVLNNYRNYIKSKNIGDTVSFIIRGCLPTGGGFNGCKDFNHTIDFIKKIIVSDDNKTVISSVLIDPVLFKTYGVTNVPQIVYAKNVNRKVDLGSEGDFTRLESIPQWWKSEGDWGLDYHFRKLYELSKEEKLKNFFH